MTFDLYICHVGLSRSFSKVKVMGKSSRSQEENVAKLVGTTSREGFLVSYMVGLRNL